MGARVYMINNKRKLYIEQEIEKIENHPTATSNICYFTNLMKKFLLGVEVYSKSDVFLTSTLIPEEIIMALDLNPIYILGGDNYLSKSVEDVFPRDADPVITATYGQAKLIDENNQMEALIIPLVNDGIRKVVENYKNISKDIFTIDIPGIKTDNNTAAIWFDNMNDLTKKLEKKYKKRVTNKKIKKAVVQRNNIKKAVETLINNNKISSRILATSVMYFIINTYFIAKDKNQWTRQLVLTNDEINRRVNQYNYQKEAKHISIIGSPMYYPNFKILNIIEDLGGTIKIVNDELISNLCNIINIHNANYVNIVMSSYENNHHPLFVKNSLAYGNALNNTTSILYYYIRGQLVYDFECLLSEQAIKDITLFRLETDYNLEDEEQLKIRIEAILEMVARKKVV